MKHIVGIADMKVTGDREDMLITYALGSCLGITIYDPVARAGGLLHVMLPASSIDPEKARKHPCMFVDTGVPRLFLECYKIGARKERLIIKVAGGANLNSQKEDHFQIGKRNYLTLRKLLWKNGVLIKSADVGNHQSRTLSLNLANGETIVKSNGCETRL